MDKQIIIRNFSRHAYTYDRYAQVQEYAAKELLRMTGQNKIDSILEIGCGTGNYTLLLKDKFKTAGLKAIDISPKMVEVASAKLKDRGIEFIVSDAETIALEEEFDLITSNACFQWFEDLDSALIRYRNLLKKGGLILFSIFGPATFKELNTSLRDTLGDKFTGNGSLMNKEKLKWMLEKNFKNAEIKENMYEESFSYLRELLTKIKYSGIRGEGINARSMLTPRILKRLEEVYLDKFKEIEATYQIFFCQGAV